MLAVRLAQAGEGAGLTALCMRSKAHWGYDAAFMRKSAAALLVSEADIAAGRVLVAFDAAGRTIGVACVIPEGETADLDVMFVDPMEGGAKFWAGIAQRRDLDHGSRAPTGTIGNAIRRARRSWC
jgi:hypothetical protein